MPTSRPRHTFTETDELREIIDRASRAFPEATRKGILEELVRLGDEALRLRALAEESRRQEDQRALEYLAAVSTGQEPGLDFDALRRVRHDHQ